MRYTGHFKTAFRFYTRTMVRSWDLSTQPHYINRLSMLNILAMFHSFCHDHNQTTGAAINMLFITKQKTIPLPLISSTKYSFRAATYSATAECSLRIPPSSRPFDEILEIYRGIIVTEGKMVTRYDFAYVKYYPDSRRRWCFWVAPIGTAA